jgi:hypothetical protein
MVPFLKQHVVPPFPEAENAAYTGTLIGPNRDLYQLPTEASQRLAVQITGSMY